MTTSIDMNAILAPFPGNNPAGEDLRYTSVYDEIREARRADDPTPRGDWEREVKSSDWSKVISIGVLALCEKSKDLQIASWVAEALTVTEGFAGIDSAMVLLKGLLRDFWDPVYPRIEDGDYDYRVAPFDFLNDKLPFSVRQIPLTDPRVTPGYGYLKWRESREVGYESDAKRGQREELLSEGKLAAEEFDAAVAKSPASFYKALVDAISCSLESFRSLDAEAEEKFGRHAPRLLDLGAALEECQRLVLKICREQKGLKDALDDIPASNPGPEAAGNLPAENRSGAAAGLPASGTPAAGFFANPAGDGTAACQETLIWDQALGVMSNRGFKEALNLLLAAASSQSSQRGRNRYRFLVAKLCLKGGRPELARPIVEQLNTTIAELQLEKWECPFWISEIYEALYQCLKSGEECDEDAARAKELFRKICTMDVTKALETGR